MTSWSRNTILHQPFAVMSLINNGYTVLIMRFVLGYIIFCCFLGGCVKRTISVTSNPPGALVWVNDREIGRTPISAEYVHSGEYDIRLELDGVEPIMTSRWTERRGDLPVIDIFADAFTSTNETKTVWHFDLIQRDDNKDSLLKRARTVRQELSGLAIE